MAVTVIMNAVKTMVARKSTKQCGDDGKAQNSAVMMATMRVLMGLMMATFLASIFVNGGAVG